MPLLHILILAIIQGLTEFLPVSSSGHLVLTHAALGHADADVNLLFDIAVHFGTLCAVILYFRSDVKTIALGCLKPNKKSEGSKLSYYVILSSLPVILFGFLFYKFNPSWARSVELTAWMTLIFGILLWVADENKNENKSVETMTVKDAIIIGLSQVLALIPGTSRSGITMTAARAIGFQRLQAARYSMLLGMVAISGAGALGILKVFRMDAFDLGYDIILSVVLSFIAAYMSIAFMMKWIEKSSFKIFAIYRVILAFILFALIYTPLFS